MSLSKFKLPKATRSSQENHDDTTHTQASNVKTLPTHNLPGRDPVRATLGAPETSNVATPSPNYSKRPSCKFRIWPRFLICMNFNSLLPDLC